jgi:hypothetical protein
MSAWQHFAWLAGIALLTVVVVALNIRAGW